MSHLKIDNIFFPKQCPFCGELTDPKKINPESCCCCEDCREKLYFYENGGNGREKGLECAPSCDKLFCVFKYVGEGKNAIRKYKFSGQTWIGKIFGESMFELLEKENVFEDCFYITYVPVSEERFAERGFDQSEYIARQLAEKSGRTTVKLLKRVVQGTRNSESNYSERRNTKGGKYVFEDSFRAYIKGKDILLVDDILTTGATLEECAKILKENGAGRVYGAVMATGRRDV